MIQPLPADILSRFHRTLVEEIRESRPDYLTGAFTVAEIYQNLVPYRTHRDRIGVEMNGDYEDALLRLLAGEGDYLVLESEHARRELKDELGSPNPNTGLFREYAAVSVRLNQARLPSPLAGEAEDEDEEGSDPHHLFGNSVILDMSGETPVPVEELAPDPHHDFVFEREPEMATEPEPMPGEPREEEAEVASAPEDGDGRAGDRAPGGCAWCGGDLPRRQIVNYCPFCGANLHWVPCSNCGEEMEPDWRFCVACGTEVQADR